MDSLWLLVPKPLCIPMHHSVPIDEDRFGSQPYTTIILMLKLFPFKYLLSNTCYQRVCRNPFLWQR